MGVEIARVDQRQAVSSLNSLGASVMSVVTKPASGRHFLLQEACVETAISPLVKFGDGVSENFVKRWVSDGQLGIDVGLYESYNREQIGPPALI